MKIAPLQEDQLDLVAGIEARDGDVHWSRKQFAAELDAEFIRFFTAVEHEEILGYGGYRKADVEAQITNLVVRKESRCQGVARRLMEFMLDCARSEGCTGCTLEVRESNRHAQSLYTSLGFSIQGTRPRLYQNPEESAVLMQKTL